MSITALRRYVPLFVWALVILTLVFIPAQIISYGYLPMDDALRHAAKAISGKPWQEILVMRSDFALDPHPGWHTILGWVHQFTDCNTEALVLVSVVGLMLLFNFCVLPWFRRPEAWLAALLVTVVFIPVFIRRLTLGRPYILTLACSMVLLLLWAHVGERRPKWWEIVSSVILFALPSWVHGSWYQLVLPAGAFLLAGYWRAALWFGGCWVAGSFLGCSFTGHPVQFLLQCVHHLFGVFGDYHVARQLVVELLPSDGDFAAVLAVAAMLLWRARSVEWRARELIDPIFMLAVLGWLLGFKVIRFWWDWGLPAAVIWLGLQFQKQFEKLLEPDGWQRLLLTAALAFGVFAGSTSDRDNHWTWNLTNEYLSQDSPEQAGWLPEPGGIIYSADMRVFNETFFKNPKAPWRYVLGFESALMLPEDLAVLRKVQWNFGDVRAYKPWIDKMRPQDRLVLRASWLRAAGQPNIPELEWKYVVSDLWVGRLPRTKP